MLDSIYTGEQIVRQRIDELTQRDVWRRLERLSRQ